VTLVLSSDGKVLKKWKAFQGISDDSPPAKAIVDANNYSAKIAPHFTNSNETDGQPLRDKLVADNESWRRTHCRAVAEISRTKNFLPRSVSPQPT